MGKFIQDGTGIVVSVADEKDERFVSGWSAYSDAEPKRGPGRPKKSDDDSK
jgi:hypothetical protein